MTKRPEFVIPERSGGATEIDYSKPAAPDFGPLARDRIPVRTMREDDLQALIAIDRRITGGDRSTYFERKLVEALHGSDVCVSLVADWAGRPAGFVIARVDFGEFGRIDPTAVLDTIGVDPDYRGQGIGRALISQLLINLMILRVEQVRTEIDWRNRDLLEFLDRCGFRPSQRLCFEHALPQPGDDARALSSTRERSPLTTGAAE